MRVVMVDEVGGEVFSGESTMLKSHVGAYTRKDGVMVKEHDDSRQKQMEQTTSPRASAGPDEAHGGHPNIVGKGDHGKEPAATASQVKFQGKEYSSTGKSGTSMHDKTPVREFEHGDSGHRVWMDGSSNVHADDSSEVESLRAKNDDASAHTDGDAPGLSEHEDDGDTETKQAEPASSGEDTGGQSRLHPAGEKPKDSSGGFSIKEGQTDGSEGGIHSIGASSGDVEKKLGIKSGGLGDADGHYSLTHTVTDQHGNSHHVYANDGEVRILPVGKVDPDSTKALKEHLDGAGSSSADYEGAGKSSAGEKSAGRAVSSTPPMSANSKALRSKVGKGDIDYEDNQIAADYMDKGDHKSLANHLKNLDTYARDTIHDHIHPDHWEKLDSKALDKNASIARYDKKFGGKKA